MRHIGFSCLFALFTLACSSSHSPSSCDGVVCAAGQLCCTTCSGPTCVDDESLCGCDGRDAGTVVRTCGGASGAGCSSAEYCDAATCGGAGTCQPRPEPCGRIYDPVCGCDGLDYANPCVANAAGVTVATYGTCEEPLACGTRGGVECPFGTYCNLGSTCGADDRGGSCVPRPTLCEEIYAPVCGCDERTYDNACSAASAGVSVASVGACETGTCEAQDATITDPSCDFAGVFWNGWGCIEMSGCCSGTDCGNGWSTVALCIAAHPSCDRSCGGWVGPTCLADELCDFSSDGCDWADASGVCRPVPEGCPDPGGVPVCGCDGNDYISECSAHLAGTDVAYVGPCAVPG